MDELSNALAGLAGRLALTHDDYLIVADGSGTTAKKANASISYCRKSSVNGKVKERMRDEEFRISNFGFRISFYNAGQLYPEIY